MKRITLAILILLAVVPLFASGVASGGEAENMTHKMTILVFQLAIIVIAVRLFGHIFSRYLKQPRVLGELVAGMVIGPYALGGIQLDFLGQQLFETTGGSLPVSPELYGFAIVASIILLFLSGLETDLPTFLRFSGVGSFVGLGGVIVSFFLGDALAVLLLPGVDNFMHPTALFLGTLSTATSVGITARILSEKRKMSSPEGVTILAAAVLDDVVGIILLAVVVGVAKVADTGGAIPWGNIGIIAAKAFGFWLIFTVLGILLGKKLTRGLKRFRSMEMLTGISFGLALLFAGLSEQAGLAMIIGAYVTGLSLSQTDVAHEIREKLEGVYAFFVPIFFCVMGMMVNFAAMKGVILFGLAYTAIAIIGKIVGCGIPALMSGFNLRGAFRIGAGMLPRGEVTLIIAGIGLASGVIGPGMFGVAIMTLLVASIIAPPTLIKSFQGGSGYRKKSRKKTTEEGLIAINLDFPTKRMTDFIRSEILTVFRQEEFFVQKMGLHIPLFHLRKDEILITLIQKDEVITLNTAPEHEQFVRLLVLEAILELKDFLKGLEGMKSPDAMGMDLMSRLFGGPSKEKKTQAEESDNGEKEE